MFSAFFFHIDHRFQYQTNMHGKSYYNFYFVDERTGIKKD